MFTAAMHASTQINYMVVNFEPWRVDDMIKRFSHDNESVYKDAVKMEKLRLDREHYLKILKI